MSRPDLGKYVLVVGSDKKAVAIATGQAGANQSLAVRTEGLQLPKPVLFNKLNVVNLLQHTTSVIYVTGEMCAI